MGADTQLSSRRWKWVAFAALLIAAGSLALVTAGIALPFRNTRVIDERLLGTWQSDADRTIAGIREQRPVDDRQEAALRKLFGTMRVTYSTTDCSIQLNGPAESSKYEVLGKDKHSVVIRGAERKPSPMDGVFELSEFVIIQFDGPDSYWLYTQIGGIREYFKRVRKPS